MCPLHLPDEGDDRVREEPRGLADGPDGEWVGRLGGEGLQDGPGEVGDAEFADVGRIRGR